MADDTSIVRERLDPVGSGIRRKASVSAWMAISIAALFFLYEFMTRIEPSLAAQSIESFYHLSDARFGTLSSLFFWVYAPMQIVVGLLLDRYGARRFVLLGILLCAGGVLLFALTDLATVAAAGRLMTGFGASFAFVAALWLVNHWFPPTRFAFLSSSVTAVGMLGTAIGGVALSQVIAMHGWREVFLATSAGGAGLFVAALLLLREPASPAAASKSHFTSHVRRNLAAIVGNPRTWIIAIIGLLYYVPVNVYAGLWGTTELVKDHHLSHVAAESLVALIFWGLTRWQRARRVALGSAGSSQIPRVFRCGTDGPCLSRSAHVRWTNLDGSGPVVRGRLFWRPADAGVRDGQGGPAERTRGHHHRLRQHDRDRRRAGDAATGGLARRSVRRRLPVGIDGRAIEQRGGSRARLAAAGISPSRPPHWNTTPDIESFPAGSMTAEPKFAAAR